MVDAAVVDDEDEDIHIIASHGFDLHRAEPKRRVALQRDDFLAPRGAGPALGWVRVVVGGVGCDGVPEADAHGGMGAGVEAQARVRDGEDGARYVHGVGAFGDVDNSSRVGGGEAV